MVDISVPSVFHGENVVYLDDLVNKSRENLKVREEECKKARKIIDMNVIAFMERNNQ